jgi:hypothetical protein
VADESDMAGSALSLLRSQFSIRSQGMAFAGLEVTYGRVIHQHKRLVRQIVSFPTDELKLLHAWSIRLALS